MLISNFISTFMSHRTFKLNKCTTDSGLSILNFPSSAFSILENNPTSPPVVQVPRLADILDFSLWCQTPSPNHLGHPIGSTSKMCPVSRHFSLATAYNLVYPAGTSCQDLLSTLHPSTIISYNSFFTSLQE